MGVQGVQEAEVLGVLVGITILEETTDEPSLLSGKRKVCLRSGSLGVERASYFMFVRLRFDMWEESAR